MASISMIDSEGLIGDDRDLHQLTCLGGVAIDPRVFKILLELLRMNVSPLAISQVLKVICNFNEKKQKPIVKPKPAVHKGKP